MKTDLGSTDLLEVEYTIGGNDYVLVEASGAAAKAYKDACTSAARMVDGKVVGVKGLGLAEPTLVSQCLYEVRGDKRYKVTIETVLAWPSRIQERLFDDAQRISKLNKKKTKEQIDEAIADLQKERDELDPTTDSSSGSG